MDITIQIKPYNGWENCLHMENGIIKMIASLDFGPRILWFSLKNQPNVFYENPLHRGLLGGEHWRNYGGHRLWHSPQVGLRPNQPDNTPLNYTVGEKFVRLTQSTEAATGIKKEMEIHMKPDCSEAVVIHKMSNMSLWPIELSAWALSMMKPGGLEIMPIPQKDTLYMPNFLISFWPWTKLNDSRFRMGEKFMFLRQNPSDQCWFKIGYENHSGLGGYVSDNQIFIKKSPLISGQAYPDYGVNFETYTDDEFLEMETLSPLCKLEPGNSLIHTEEWKILPCCVSLENEGELGRLLGI